MLKKDIKEGETYLFLATDSPARKHLEGQPFTVQQIKKVYRKAGGKWPRQLWRFFNDDGIGARASELEPIDEPAPEFPTVELRDDDGPYYTEPAPTKY